MKRIGVSGILAALCGLLPFCEKSGHDAAQEHMHKTSFEDLVARFESKERDAYQKPDQVMDHLDLLFRKHATIASQFSEGWQGLKVADLGAGTGYFSFRMADRGASVLALDIDSRFLDFIQNHPSFERSNIEIRKVGPDDAGLSESEVDVIFSVNVYHHIDNRANYFRSARKGLRDGGLLVIIDFKQGKMPVGPPEHIKLSQKEVKSELEQAGFRVEVDELLDYQNIYVGYPASREDR